MNLPRLPKAMDLWLPSMVREAARRLRQAQPLPRRLYVAITDHYEPRGGNASVTTALARVAAWQERWPQIASAAPHDAAGQAPRYSFFYPQEEYQRQVVAALEPICRAGIGDVEVHIHHDNDTALNFAAKMREFCLRLHEVHGMLRQREGRLIFGFIHGNWALDNSRPDGHWCGVQGELQILRELGCYADFTMPSLPSRTQSRIVNQIYWTAGDPARPRGFDRGIPATVGGGFQDGLLMIPGPAGLRFQGRLRPRVEMGELAAYDPPTHYRIDRWLALCPRVGDDLFLKLYTHGAREDNAAALLGTAERPGDLQNLFAWLAKVASERNLELHWTSAFEMFEAVERLVLAPSYPVSFQTAEVAV